jgi:hypothetical protein
MTERELILYATPTGALAEACERYFVAIEGVGATTAQTYPPHCTLTGFFRRSGPRSDEVVAEMGRRIRAVGPQPADAIEVTGPIAAKGWVGLTIESAWLIDLAASTVAGQVIGDGEDAIRLKGGLHLSLAYEVEDTAAYEELARPFFGEVAVGPGAALGGVAPWELGVWERNPDGGWTRLR